MLLDNSLGLFIPRPRQGFRGLRLAVDQAVLRRVLFGLPPLGLFARGAQIDDGSHGEIR
jgi:hypothetical protein